MNEYRKRLGLPPVATVPSLFEEKVTPADPPQSISPFPDAMDPYRERLGLPTSPMYQRQKGITPSDEAETDLIRMIAEADDPMEIINTFNTGEYLAKTLNVPRALAFNNIDELSEYWSGKVLPAPTLVQNIKSAMDNGMRNYDIGNLGFELMNLETTGGSPERIVAIEEQIAELEKQMVTLPYTPKQWLRYALTTAAQSVPLMVKGMTKGYAMGAATGATAGAMLGIEAAAASVTSGLSVPAMALAMASVGQVVGMTKDMMDNSAGLQYLDLRKKGVPSEINGPISVLSGAVQGALESAGEILVLGVVKVPGLKSLGTMVANKLFMTGMLGRVATSLASRGASTALGEGAEEVLQELTAAVAEQVARDWSKAMGTTTQIPPADMAVFLERFKQSFIGGASAGLLFGVAGLPSGVRADVKQFARIKTLAVVIPDKNTFIEATEKLGLAEGPASKAAWKTYLGKVYDVQQAKIQQEIQKRNAKEKPKAGEPAAPGAPSPVMGPLTREKGALATEVKVKGKSKEGVNATLVVGDAAKQERYGYVNFETVGETVYIKDVVSESAAQDVSREMILELGEKNPGKTIEWNPIDEKGVELKEDLIAKNPLGPQVGLNWAPAETEGVVTPRTAITRDYFSQQMTKLFNLAPEEADAMVGLAEALSANAGLPVEDWLNKYINPEVGANTKEEQASLQGGGNAAQVTFFAGGQLVEPLQVDRAEFAGRVKATFAAIQGADFHLAVHEFFHMVERLALSPDQVKGFERAIGDLREVWTVPQVERLANLFEEYLSTGQAPTKELTTLFQKIAEIFNQIVSFLTQQGHEALSPEFKQAYDALFAKPESGVAQNIRKPTFPRVSRAEVTMPLEQAVIQPKVEEPVRVSAIDPKAVPVEEIELSRITLSKDVPQFKKEANVKGVIEELKGKKYLRLGTAPIVLWERTGGELEVITGRHRFDLAQRLGEESIPSQIVRESEGFTAAKALTFDAESNIRDGMGSIEDYVIYFRATEIDEGTAEARGLLGTDKGRKGFAIGRYATDGLLALYFGGEINETKAAGIAAASRGDPRLTAVGIKNKAASAEQIVQQIEILKTYAPSSDVQTDMFGNEVYEESDKLASEQVKKLHELKAEQSALSSMNKLSKGEAEKTAGKYGFKAGDTKAVKARMAMLASEIPGWMGKEWISDPAKIAELKARAGVGATALFHPDFELRPLTEDELAQQRAKETARVKGKEAAASQQTFGFAKKTDAQMKDEKAQLALFHSAPEEIKAFNERAIKEFGVTTDPEYAAWILTTGEMLDFRAKGIDYAGNLSTTRMAHATIKKVLGEIPPMSTPYHESWKMGTLRMDFNKYRSVIQSVMKPTPEQMATIGEWIGQTREIGLELMGLTNDSDYYAYKDIMNPTIDLVADFYTASELYTRVEDTHLYHAAALREGDENRLWTLRSEEVIREKMKGPMPTENVRAMLIGAGVKADEMKWMGLDDLLAKGGKVTPEELLTHLRENGVKIIEVRKWTGPTSMRVAAGRETNPDQAKFGSSNLVLPGGENYQELLFRLPSEEEVIGVDEVTGAEGIEETGYRGPHWMETGVVAHTRFNDRVDSEGKRTLFIEEIQSDWHQAGREKGYAGEKTMAVFDAYTGGTLIASGYGSRDELLTFLGDSGWTKLREMEIRERQITEQVSGVPPAPFSKTWHEMAFRRMVRWAAENGYDSLAWTTGEQQAERYDLAKQVREIKSYKQVDGTYDLEVFLHDRDHEEIRGIKPEKLQDYIGKDLAEKIAGSPTRINEWAGLDLKVGGEGMKGFYDKILVDYANKFGKRFGAKTGESIIPLPDSEDYNGPAPSDQAIDQGGYTVHSLPITDSMRESVGKGIALFHPDMENADNKALYDSLIRKAANYDTAEEFQKDMEETFGEADPSAADRYKRLWDAAHPVETPPVEAPKTGIPMPEEAVKEYDYGEKLDLAQTISDPALAQQVEQGDITDAQVDKATEKGVAGDEALKEKLKTAQLKIDEALASFTPEEQYVLTLADELSTITAFEGKAKRMQNKIASLRGRLKTALKKNARLSLLLADTAEGFKFDADIQKAIADERIKLIQLTETDKRLQQKARMYAERRAAMAKFRDQTRAAMADRRALMQLKETRKKLIKQIMAPPSRTVEYLGYADRIQEIQEQLDPDNHRVKTLEERKASKAFFDANSDAAALVPKDTLERIYSVPVQKLTLAQLEELNELIQGLRKLGRMKRSLEIGQDKRGQKATIKSLANTILRGEALQPVIGAAKKTGVFLRLWMEGLKPGRMAQLIDGIFAGQPAKGAAWDILQTVPNRQWTAMRRMMDKRLESVMSQLPRLKITLDPTAIVARGLKGYTYLGETMDIDGFRFTNGKMPTLQKVMYWYLGMKNERTRAALLQGNKYPLEIVEKAIAQLPQNVKELAGIVAQDWEDNFPRYREAFIKQFNVDLPKEDHYVTMVRLQISYASREDSVVAELTGRSGTRKQFVARHSTFSRIDIPDEFQKPIADDLMSVWQSSVTEQEGFIFQDKMIKDMHSILESDEVRGALQQKFGPAMNKWVSDYINDLAQEDAYKSQKEMEKWSRIMRSHAAVAWLGFNLLSSAKQLVGVMNALADAGPLYMASAAAQFAAGQGKSIVKGNILGNTLVDFVEERSPFIKHSSPSQELEDLQRLDKPGYEQLVKKVGKLGMLSLQVIDKVSRVIGWKAVYDKVMAKTQGDEAAAILAADEATARTQPSMRVQDMAAMYRGGEAFKWFTMFTSDLNSTYNRLAFDVPAALRNGHILSALADMLTFSISGVAIAIASGALHGDDPEKKKRMLVLGAFSQYFDAIPFIGNDVWSALSGRRFQSGGVKIFPAIEYLQQIPYQIGKEQWDKVATSLAEGVAFFVGLPVSGPRRAVKAFTMGDWEALLGWQNKKE